VRELMEGLEDSQVERESEQVVWSYLQSPATLSDMAEFLPDTRYISRSVANTLQNFSASPKETFRPLRRKLRSPGSFHLLKEFGLKKNTIFVCVSGKITIFLGLP
jgi:hypothetical protein